MEAFDLAVGLWSAWTGELRPDTTFGACVSPGVGSVGGTVVREHPFDADAADGEPGHCPFQNTDRSLGFLIVVDLGVSNTGVVIDHGVNERVPHENAAMFASFRAAGRRPVPIALLSSDESPTAAVGKYPGSLIHVDVKKL